MFFFVSVCVMNIYRLINIVQIDDMYCKSVSSHCPVFKIYCKFGTLPSEQARSRVSMLSIPVSQKYRHPQILAPPFQLKNAHCRSLLQKFSATMSNLAPSSLFAVLCVNCSSVTGCRQGSVYTNAVTNFAQEVCSYISKFVVVD